MKGGAGDWLLDPNSLPGVLHGAHICGCPDQGFFKVDQKAGSGVDVRAAASGEPANTVPSAGRLFYSWPRAWLSPVMAVVSILLIHSHERPLTCRVCAGHGVEAHGRN